VAATPLPYPTSGASTRRNSLMHTHQNLEARVGIGLLMPCFPRNLKPLSEQFQYNLALFVLTRLNSLTEGFTERDMRSLEQLFVMDTS
jgi:hypothetical protein